MNLLDKADLAWRDNFPSLIGFVSLRILHKNLSHRIIVGTRRLTSSDNL